MNTFYSYRLRIIVMSIVSVFCVRAMDGSINVTMYMSNNSDMPFYIDYKDSSVTYEFSPHQFSSRSLYSSALFSCESLRMPPDQGEVIMLQARDKKNRYQNRSYSCIADEQGVLMDFSWTVRYKGEKGGFETKADILIPWKDITGDKMDYQERVRCGAQTGLLNCCIGRDSKKSLTMAHIYVAMKFTDQMREKHIPETDAQ